MFNVQYKAYFIIRRYILIYFKRVITLRLKKGLTKANNVSRLTNFQLIMSLIMKGQLFLFLYLSHSYIQKSTRAEQSFYSFTNF